MLSSVIGERIKQLRTYYALSINDFAILCGISSTALFNIEKGKRHSMQASSINKLILTFGTTREWLLNGRGEMLPNGKVDIEEYSLMKNGMDRITTYFELKIRNEMLEKEVERLWSVVLDKKKR